MLLVGFRHRHAGSLLRGHGVSALEGRRHDDAIADLVRPVIVDHPVGEVRRRCGGTRIADDVARLHIIGAELAHGVEIAADVGDVVVVPQAADLFLVRVDLGFAVGIGCEQVDAHLPHADDEVVGQGIAAVERLAVVGDVGRQRIGVCVITLRGGGDALLRCQAVDGGAGGLGERLPVRFIEHGHLGGFRHWQQVQGIVVVEAALVKVVGHIVGQLIGREVVRQIDELALSLHVIGRVGVGGEHVGHLLGADFARRRV